MRVEGGFGCSLAYPLRDEGSRSLQKDHRQIQSMKACLPEATRKHQETLTQPVCVFLWMFNKCDNIIGLKRYLLE